MAIRGIDRATFEQMLPQMLTPTTPIRSPEFLRGPYERFHNLKGRIHPLSLDLAALITNPPGEPPLSVPLNRPALEAALRTQNCMIRLAAYFDGFEAKLDRIADLVGVASKMADSQDELLVIAVLRLHASGFLDQLKFHQHVLNLTVRTCSEDGATVAKSQEIRRIYTDAGSLVESIIKKIGVGPP
jgi:hypothetical protein